MACVSLDGLTSRDASTSDDGSDFTTVDANDVDAANLDAVFLETSQVDATVPVSEGADSGAQDGATTCEGSACSCAASPDACMTCCESLDLDATQHYLTRVWEDCACSAFACFASCSQTCASPPTFSTTCTDCLEKYAESPGCNEALSHCLGDPMCQSLAQCIKQCP